MSHPNTRTLLFSLFACYISFIAFAPVAEARCVPPKLALSSAKAERGAKLTVTGQYFWDRCNDVVINGQTPAKTEGAKNIKIFLRLGDQSRLLATVDADAALRFSVVVSVPLDAPIGMAIIVAEAAAYPAEWVGKGGETPQPIALEVVDSVR